MASTGRIYHHLRCGHELIARSNNLVHLRAAPTLAVSKACSARGARQHPPCRSPKRHPRDCLRSSSLQDFVDLVIIRRPHIIAARCSQRAAAERRTPHSFAAYSTSGQMLPSERGGDAALSSSVSATCTRYGMFEAATHQAQCRCSQQSGREHRASALSTARQRSHRVRIRRLAQSDGRRDGR